jgi:hypothetical protein
MTGTGPRASTVAWHLEHSVEAEVSATSAWSFWTDVRNWDDPPARFELDGPFAVGSKGSTLIPAQEPLHWSVREVRPGDVATIEMPLDRATLSFEWRFEALSEHRTRLTQRIALSGENSEAYVGQVQAGFGTTLRAGMERIARLMEAAGKRSTRPVP